MRRAPGVLRVCQRCDDETVPAVSRTIPRVKVNTHDRRGNTVDDWALIRSLAAQGRTEGEPLQRDGGVGDALMADPRRE